MREISLLEKKVARHIYNLQTVTFESIIACEFDNTHFMIDGHNITVYYKIEKGANNEVAKLKTHNTAQEIIEFCAAVVSTLKLLESHGMLVKKREWIFRKRNEFFTSSQTSFLHDTGVDQLGKGFGSVSHFINIHELPNRLKELDGTFFFKTSDLDSYIKNGFITSAEKRERDNLKIAKWALIVSAGTGIASLLLEIYDKFLKTL